jgi:hypothetical protein
MNNLSRYALPALAGAVILILGLAALNVFGFKSSRPPGQTPATTATPEPTARPVTLDVKNRGQALDPGTYSVTIPERATYTFTVPSGWIFDDVGSGRVALYRSWTHEGQWLNYLLIDSVKSVYVDPCNVGAGGTNVDQSVAGIVDAFTHQDNFTASEPVDAHLSGADGKTFTVDITRDAAAPSGACSGVDIALWRDGSDFDALSGSNHQRLWVLDLGRGNPVVVEVMGYPWTSGADQQSAEDIVASMKFE